MELQKRSSDFRRSVYLLASEDGTKPYRPKTELVPYSAFHCTFLNSNNVEYCQKMGIWGHFRIQGGKYKLQGVETLYIKYRLNRAVKSYLRQFGPEGEYVRASRVAFAT